MSDLNPSFSDTEALSTVTPLRTKIALPYWSCGRVISLLCESFQVYVGDCVMAQGGVPGGRECHKCSVSVQYTVQPIYLAWQHVRPSMLDETILRAGSDKDPC